MAKLETKRPWREVTFIGFDTETTGKYPLQAEICEIAAVKWRAGKIIDEFQTLLKPSEPMSQEVIDIHNITNEMVAQAPVVADKIGDFHRFIEDGILVAHHAPFDLGFVAIEFEKQNLPLPESPVLCSSLISRKAIPDSPNHRLQTLIQHLNIEQGQAHRALDDARACLEVGLYCFSKIGEQASLEDLLKFQEVRLNWKDYSIEHLKDVQAYARLAQAIREGREVEMTYMGGSKPGRARKVQPVGIIRNHKGDSLVALSEGKSIPKRYFLSKVSKVMILY